MKLIIPLLALCLTLSVASVGAQANMLGNVSDVNVIMTGDISETITCSITGNAVMVEEMGNATDNMTNATGNMTNATDNMSATENMTLDVTGKIILIKDLGNMTEKAVMIGSVDDMPGKVIIFGEKENMTEDMSNVSEVMGDITKNMTVFMVGNMTGEIMLNKTEGMENMTESMGNMTVVMSGNMTGNVTGDMTKKVVIIKNIGDITEMVEKMCNITEMDSNMTANMSMPEPMQCSLTGKAVIVKSMDNMTEMEEDMSDLVLMDANKAVIGDIQDMTKMDEKNG
ncbi:hypothetical protein [Methanosarcina horonobensis]|uniref:hypothetical protein n=1 Tax=Methanosarcina horonobensis TaxID=418008 RepID=UPI0022B8A345|nr:hypothetical protein [Methanosarcina horonobensis]